MEITEGTLGGINPSEEELDGARDRLKANSDKPAEEPAAEEPAPAPQNDKPRTGGAPSREYVVLEEVMFDDDDTAYYHVVHRVEARNAPNAMRKAAKELRADFDGEKAETTLSVVPASMWRPTAVTLSKKEQVSVSIGG